MWPNEESLADDSLYICGSTGHPFKLSTLVIAVCAQVNPPTRRSRVGYVGKLDSPLNKLKVTAVVYLYRFNSAAARRIGSRKSRGTPVPPRYTNASQPTHCFTECAVAPSGGKRESAPSGLWSTRIRYM